MAIIDRDAVSAHLWAIPELDHSGDLFAKPLQEQWLRLGARTKGNDIDERGVRDVIERQSLLLSCGVFESIDDNLTSIGNALGHLGKPQESIENWSGGKQHFVYRAFHAFKFHFAGAVGEPVAFFPEAEGAYGVMLNPDLLLYFSLEEKPYASGCWWDPARSVEVIRHQKGGSLEFIEIRVDYLLKYLRVRQMSLIIGHYRHFHLLNPTEAVKATLEEGEVVLRGAEGAKAIIQSFVGDDGHASLLIRRLHLWHQVMPPALDVETVFDEEPDFDILGFTFPTHAGDVAPARFKQSALLNGAHFAGVSCNYMDRVYFRQEVLGKYQGSVGFTIGDDGSLRCGGFWGLTRSTSRIGNELLASAIGDFAEGVPFHEWSHWKQHAVPPPSVETKEALADETTIPDAVNRVGQRFEALSDTFERFAENVGAPVDRRLWDGNLDSLAGRQLKWVYPATAADEEFLARMTLASTLFLDSLDSAQLRCLLRAFGSELHQGRDRQTLGSRNLLQRTALIAGLICSLRPQNDELPDLVAWAEAGSGAPEADLQRELTSLYSALRKEFSPLAFLYDLRIAGGLAHPPSAQKVAIAAKNFGLREKEWRRADFLLILHQIELAVGAVICRITNATADMCK